MVWMMCEEEEKEEEREGKKREREGGGTRETHHHHQRKKMKVLREVYILGDLNFGGFCFWVVFHFIFFFVVGCPSVCFLPALLCGCYCFSFSLMGLWLVPELAGRFFFPLYYSYYYFFQTLSLSYCPLLFLYIVSIRIHIVGSGNELITANKNQYKNQIIGCQGNGDPYTSHKFDSRLDRECGIL